MNIINRVIVLCIVSFMGLLGSSCTPNTPQHPKVQIKRPSESFLKYGDDNSSIVELNKVNHSVWIHTSYYDYNGSLAPSNGLVVITDKGLVLIDTPWTDKQMESLDKLCKEAFNASFHKAIISHAHIDRMGGGGYLKKHGINMLALKRVSEKADELGFQKVDEIFEGDEVKIQIDNTEFEIYFPGEGHTSDNTVVWIDKYDLLFAGCLVKEHGVASLGNVSEANIKEWPSSLNTLIERYQDMAIVIPGHGQWGDKSLVDYTLELFDE